MFPLILAIYGGAILVLAAIAVDDLDDIEEEYDYDDLVVQEQMRRFDNERRLAEAQSVAQKYGRVAEPSAPPIAAANVAQPVSLYPQIPELHIYRESSAQQTNAAYLASDFQIRQQRGPSIQWPFQQQQQYYAPTYSH